MKSLTNEINAKIRELGLPVSEQEKVVQELDLKVGNPDEDIPKLQARIKALEEQLRVEKEALTKIKQENLAFEIDLKRTKEAREKQDKDLSQLTDLQRTVTEEERKLSEPTQLSART